MLNEESPPLVLWLSWVKTEIQAFSDILDAAIFCVAVCGEDVEVTERFTCLGRDIHVSAGCEPEFNRVWIGPGESWIHWIFGVSLLVPVQEDENPCLQVHGASNLALWM